MQPFQGVVHMCRYKRPQILRFLRKNQAALTLHIQQLHGNALDFPVFDQPFHQLCTRIIAVVLVVIEILDLNDRRLWQQQLALDG
ncbi:hypothetical protein D3C84_1011840 [compost metagenome]